MLRGYLSQQKRDWQNYWSDEDFMADLPTSAETSNQTGQGGQGEVSPDILGLIGHMGQQQQHVQQQTSKHDEVISKLEKVFSKAEPQADDWYDDVLKTALEAEKHGHPIPLTVKISTELRNAQKTNEVLMRELAELKQRSQIKDNPAFQADQAAYNHIDMYMGQELKSAFGDNIPKAVASAVTQDLVEKIQEEQRTNPERWKQIRSDPNLMQRVVRNAVAQVIPQKARNIVAQQQQENAVYEPNEIRENIAEAVQLLRSEEVQRNPAYYAKVEASITKMREMLWESMIPGQNRRARV